MPPRGCFSQEYIEQGDLRVGLDAPMRRIAPGHVAKSWRHLHCFLLPIGFECHHLKGFEALSKEDQRTVQERLKEVMSRPAARPGSPQRSSRRAPAPQSRAAPPHISPSRLGC